MQERCRYDCQLDADPIFKHPNIIVLIIIASPQSTLLFRVSENSNKSRISYPISHRRTPSEKPITADTGREVRGGGGVQIQLKLANGKALPTTSTAPGEVLLFVPSVFRTFLRKSFLFSGSLPFALWRSCLRQSTFTMAPLHRGEG